MEKFRSLKDRIDNSLLEERKVFLWGMVNDESARHVVERLIYLDSVDPGKEISLIINSPGGYVTSGFAIHDTIKRSEEHTSELQSLMRISYAVFCLKKKKNKLKKKSKT